MACRSCLLSKLACFIVCAFQVSCWQQAASDLPSDAIAEINGELLSRSRYEAAVAQTMQHYAGRTRSSAVELERRVRPTVLQQLIADMIISQQAEKLDIAVTPMDVARQYAEYRARFADEEDFNAYLHHNFIDANALLDSMRRNLLKEQVVAKLKLVTPVTDADIEAYYHHHRGRFTQPQCFRLRRLLVRVVHPRDDEIAHSKANALHSKAEQHPEQFGLLARQFSQGIEAPLDGDMQGCQSAEHLAPTVLAAVQQLEDGQISACLKTPAGYEIIQRQSHQPEKLLSLAQVREAILAELTARRRTTDQREVLSQLMQNAKITYATRAPIVKK